MDRLLLLRLRRPCILIVTVQHSCLIRHPGVCRGSEGRRQLLQESVGGTSTRRRRHHSKEG